MLAIFLFSSKKKRIFVKRDASKRKVKFLISSQKTWTHYDVVTETVTVISWLPVLDHFQHQAHHTHRTRVRPDVKTSKNWSIIPPKERNFLLLSLWWYENGKFSERGKSNGRWRKMKNKRRRKMRMQKKKHEGWRETKITSHSWSTLFLFASRKVKFIFLMLFLVILKNMFVIYLHWLPAKDQRRVNLKEVSAPLLDWCFLSLWNKRCTGFF